MLGGLGGDAAELLGVQLHLHGLPHPGGGVVGDGFVQKNLGFGVFHIFVYDHLGDGDGELALFGVDDDVYVVSGLIVPLDGDDDGVLDLFDQIVCADAFFHFQQLKRIEKIFHFFGVHDGPPFYLDGFLKGHFVLAAYKAERGEGIFVIFSVGIGDNNGFSFVFF